MCAEWGAVSRESPGGTECRLPAKSGRSDVLLVQVESTAGLDNIENIACVDGVDGVFLGPADLAASLGYLGNPHQPEVPETIENGIACVLAAGEPAGILRVDESLARRYLDLGCTFVAVGVDTTLLAHATTETF